jgi:hypothetical protein
MQTPSTIIHWHACSKNVEFSFLMLRKETKTFAESDAELGFSGCKTARESESPTAVSGCDFTCKANQPETMGVSE